MLYSRGKGDYLFLTPQSRLTGMDVATKRARDVSSSAQKEKTRWLCRGPLNASDSGTVSLTRWRWRCIQVT